MTLYSGDAGSAGLLNKGLDEVTRTVARGETNPGDLVKTKKQVPNQEEVQLVPAAFVISAQIEDHVPLQKMTQ